MQSLRGKESLLLQALFPFWRQRVYICALNEKPALRISLTGAAEAYSTVHRNSALGNNYVIAIIRGTSSL